MKLICTLLMFCFFTTVGFAQVNKNLASKPDPNKQLLSVDVSCGECNFGMHGNDCAVAIILNGKNYFVDGVGISDYGHPHAKDGFCMAVHKAEIQGEIVKDRFKATYFKRLEKTTNPTESK